MRKLHVLMKKEELDGQRLDGKVVIVLDILFATTTIVAALSEGASEVWPALDGDAARESAIECHAGQCSGDVGQLSLASRDLVGRLTGRVGAVLHA